MLKRQIISASATDTPEGWDNGLLPVGAATLSKPMLTYP